MEDRWLLLFEKVDVQKVQGLSTSEQSLELKELQRGYRSDVIVNEMYQNDCECLICIYMCLGKGRCTCQGQFVESELHDNVSWLLYL